MNGNWASLDMKQLGASTTMASLALTAFWASVTLGRVLFAAIRARFPTRRTYHLLPFVLAGAFVGIASLPSGEPGIGVVAFALAGLGCSALLPLTISFGQEELVVMSASVAGGLIAFYQLGYGVAAFGAGPLQASGIDLSALFAVTGLVAVAMGAGAYVIARSRDEPPASIRDPRRPVCHHSTSRSRIQGAHHEPQGKSRHRHRRQQRHRQGDRAGAGRARGQRRHRLRRRTRRRPRSWSEQIVGLGDQAIGVDADVSKIADLQRLVDTAVEQFGRVDIMVNNAGVETRSLGARHHRGAVREGARRST